MGKNNATLPDFSTFWQAGIDPKTGLPVRMGGQGASLKEQVKAQIRITDEQDAVNRYTWYNLPANISSQELERMLYYKGQLAFFRMPTTGEFFFMPYALDGGLDFYGRFNRIHPIPFAEGTSDEEKKKFAEQRNFLSTLKLNCLYDVVLPEEWDPAMMDGCCVLLHDYTKQLSQTIIPRQRLQEGLIDVMSDTIPFMRTALLNSTGIMGMRVSSEDEQSNVAAASALINRAATLGEKYVAIVGQMEFQDLTGGDVAKSEEFLLALEALDNFRLATYGIDNGGVYQKKAHMLQSEQDAAGGAVGLVYQDGLSIRQRFCDIVNSNWGTVIWCEPNEQAANIDINGDGMMMDEQDQSGTMKGQQPQVPQEV